MPRYVIIDTETSGLPLYAKKGEPPPAADAPGQPRLASFTALVTTPELEVDEEQSITALIRPDGWVMSEGAMAVNGLTMDKLGAEGINVRDVLGIYSEYIANGWIVVAHNAQFDTKIMRGELRRVGMDDLFEQTLNICTMRATLEVLKLAPTHAQLASGRRGFKQPKLMEAYQYFYGDEFPDAHTSMADAHACLAVFRKLIEIGQCPEPSILRAGNYQG
jgi:DNA polymerase III epsilon subunit-like protein